MKQGLIWVLVCLFTSACGGVEQIQGAQPPPHNPHHTDAPSCCDRAPGAGGLWLCQCRGSGSLW